MKMCKNCTKVLLICRKILLDDAGIKRKEFDWWKNKETACAGNKFEGKLRSEGVKTQSR